MKGNNDEAFDIHFVALFSEREDAVPIMLNHGWPGSFLEFLPLLQLMKDQYTPQTLPFHLVATSMPGYGFSTPPPTHREFDFVEVPGMFNQVMLDLGFGGGYIASGGDIGSRFARILAAKHEACKGMAYIIHLLAQANERSDPRELCSHIGPRRHSIRFTECFRESRCRPWRCFPGLRHRLFY